MEVKMLYWCLGAGKLAQRTICFEKDFEKVYLCHKMVVCIKATIYTFGYMHMHMRAHSYMQFDGPFRE